MWIRNQSKKSLTNISELIISNTKDNSKYYIYGYSERQLDILGVYSTQDKALKVLDEIQRKVEYPGSTLFSPTSLKNYYCLTPTGQFYQMPQDDEVEIWS